MEGSLCEKKTKCSVKRGASKTHKHNNAVVMYKYTVYTKPV